LIAKSNIILSLFLLTQEAQKKKLRKKKTLFFGGSAPLDPVRFLKKAKPKTFHLGLCVHCALNSYPSRKFFVLLFFKKVAKKSNTS
jgi:hypothetical protein